MATLKQVIKKEEERLSSIYGAREAEWMLRTIFEHLKGWNRVELIVRSDDEVSDFIAGETEKIVDRLLKHEPIQYIFGDTYWHGLTIKVNPSVLIPRPETSELVDIIAKENKGYDLKVLDICTGSGCIAVALAKELNFPDVTAIDISEKALEVAEENARLNKVKVSFFKADALNLEKAAPRFNPADSYDIIVSNPPYVMESEKKDMPANVIGFEPHIALFVPDTAALRFYDAISKYAFDALRPGGKLYFELNPLTAKSLRAKMADQGWSDVQIVNDMYGKKRFIIARK